MSTFVRQTTRKMHPDFIAYFFIFAVYWSNCSPLNNQKSLFNSGDVGGSQNKSVCLLKYPKLNLALETYYINLDKSADRRSFMQAQLRYYGLIRNYRVRAIIPEQVQSYYVRKDKEGCWSISEKEALEHHFSQNNITKSLSSHSNFRSNKYFAQYINSLNKHVVMLSLCGRPRNTRHELIVSLSHINAINYATTKTLYNASDMSNFALILEDDLYFAFEINFPYLISLAPKDFAIIQLVTSNDYSVLNLWRVFERHKALFVKRKPHDDYWCAGAYLINKAKLSNLTQSLLYRQTNYSNIFISEINTGYEKPDCYPSMCCAGGRFQPGGRCVKSSRGYAADNLIFTLSLENTYMFTLPIMMSHQVGNFSTVHQKHVTFHQPAFHRMSHLIQSHIVPLASQHSILSRVFNTQCQFNYTAMKERVV